MQTSAPRPIANIGTFLEACPDRDPAFSTIIHDFELRRDGLLVPLPTCREPISGMSTSQYTDELIVLQGLRVIYYMDRGQSGHLPWTTGTLYDWMKSKIGGINIVSGGGSSCCVTYGGRLFINVGAEDDFNRDFDRRWQPTAHRAGHATYVLEIALDQPPPHVRAPTRPPQRGRGPSCGPRERGRGDGRPPSHRKRGP